MDMFDEYVSKKEILKRVGDISQLGGLKKYIFNEGISNGIRAIDMDNGNGLVITVLLDRAMDIADAKYKGIPIAWKSSTFETPPCYFDKENKEWLRSFFGGLLTTCGLTYMGGPCNDHGEDLGLHGRISNLPARLIEFKEKWVEEKFEMNISGKIREATTFGHKLELTRDISMNMGEDKLFINDVIENIGSLDSPLMVLYLLLKKVGQKKK